MLVDRKLMSAKRKHTEKVREILKTAKNQSILDRSTISQEIKRFTAIDTYQDKENFLTRTLERLYIHHNNKFLESLLEILRFYTALFSVVFYYEWKFHNIFTETKDYTSARNDAEKNISDKLQLSIETNKTL